MDRVPIIKKSMNLEIWCKISNSIAKKHNCRIKFDANARQPVFYGDGACKGGIIKETISIFNWE